MRTSKKLQDMPIGKLIAVMSLPAIFSMLIQAMYNIVDSIYVGKISPEALNAVSLAYPMQILVLAFSLGIGIGTSSLISRKLGEKKHDEASNVAKIGLIMSIIASVLFLLIGVFASNLLFNMMSNDQEVVRMGTDYLMIVTSLSFFSIVTITLTRILQGVGNMIVPMISQLVGAIINIILDPIFIFTLDMGVSGAAIATVIGQVFSFALVIAIFIFKKQDVSINPIGVKYNSRQIKDIFNVGLPITIMNSVASLTTTILNSTLYSSYPTEEMGKAAVNVLGIYFKLQSFVFMPIFGINQGGMPILGYSFGANLKKRYTKALRIMLISSVVIMSLGFIMFQTIPEVLLNFFSPNEEMIDIGVRALPIISLSFIPASFSIIFAMSFQAIGHGYKSLLMSLFRQVIVLIPTAILLSKININSIWYSYSIAEGLTALIFVPIAIYTVHKAFAFKSISDELIYNN